MILHDTSYYTAPVSNIPDIAAAAVRTRHMLVHQYECSMIAVKE